MPRRWVVHKSERSGETLGGIPARALHLKPVEPGPLLPKRAPGRRFEGPGGCVHFAERSRPGVPFQGLVEFLACGAVLADSAPLWTSVRFHPPMKQCTGGHERQRARHQRGPGWLDSLHGARSLSLVCQAASYRIGALRVRRETSGGTRNRTGRMLVPTPELTNR